tara:strand:- start:409 stop:645 length:237 start_codon:yes stop_codon:yes gene_type:complete
MSEQKSGFEIRADLLNQAQGILQDNRSMKMDWYHNQVMRAQDNKDVAWPEYPQEALAPITPQDVIAVAKQFNEFVNQK